MDRGGGKGRMIGSRHWAGAGGVAILGALVVGFNLELLGGRPVGLHHLIGEPWLLA